MSIRSFLFVPGDSERKQAKALGSEADALILDLEDSVAPARLDVARGTVAAFLSANTNRSTQQLWVRVNSLSSGQLLEDLVAVMPAAPDGIVLPKASSSEELVQVHHYLTALEYREGRAIYSTQVLVIATETPRAVLNLNGYRPGPERLFGLTWGMEDLGTALGATGKVDEAGELTFTFQMARSMCLVAAVAAGVQPIDSVHADFRDRDGLTRECARARRDGFTGKMAIHPDQVAIINQAFTPTEAELAHARRVIAAFEASPDAGVTSLDGAMLDRPHLLQAQRVLAAVERRGKT
jgi:citrate lyase subunit beta / citryl-CoA lyase